MEETVNISMNNIQRSVMQITTILGGTDIVPRWFIPEEAGLVGNFQRLYCHPYNYAVVIAKFTTPEKGLDELKRAIHQRIDQMGAAEKVRQETYRYVRDEGQRQTFHNNEMYVQELRKKYGLPHATIWDSDDFIKSVKASMMV